jgi:hypothetical protein
MFITKINNPRRESKKTIPKKKHYCDEYNTCIHGSIRGTCKINKNPKKCNCYEEIEGRCLTFEIS